MAKTFIHFGAQLCAAVAVGVVIAHLMVVGAMLYATGLALVFTLFIVKRDWIREIRAVVFAAKPTHLGRTRTGEAAQAPGRGEAALVPGWWVDVKNKLPTNYAMVDQRKLRFRR